MWSCRVPRMTSTSKIEIASIMPATSWPLPESVRVWRALSARTMAPRRAIGSRIRRVSEAATYLSCTTCRPEPSLRPGSGALPVAVMAPARRLVRRHDLVRPMLLTMAAPLERSADWSRSTAATFVTGFGVEW